MVRDGRQISFDVIANIRKVVDRDDPKMCVVFVSLPSGLSLERSARLLPLRNKASSKSGERTHSSNEPSVRRPGGDSICVFDLRTRFCMRVSSRRSMCTIVVSIAIVANERNRGREGAKINWVRRVSGSRHTGSSCHAGPLE